MITKLQITGKLHYHRKCDFQLSKRKLRYRTLLPLTAPIVVSVFPLSGYRYLGDGGTDRREILHDGTYKSRKGFLPLWGGAPGIS